MSTKNLISATMMILSHSILAIDLSGGVSGSRSAIEIDTSTRLTPNFTVNDEVFSGIVSPKDIKAGFNAISADLYGHYEYKEMVGIYGHISLSNFLDREKITNVGSLKISVHSWMPSVDFGGYLYTQSGSKASAGLKVSWLGLDLNHLNDGLDFNGYNVPSDKGKSAFTPSITLQISTPITENFETYLSTDYGLSFGTINLNATTNPAISLAQPEVDHEPIGLGNIYGILPNVLQSNISIGTRFTFKEI